MIDRHNLYPWNGLFSNNNNINNYHNNYYNYNNNEHIRSCSEILTQDLGLW
jgi:hypothetical protein